MGSQTSVPPKGSANAAQQPPALISWAPFIGVVAIMYFFLIRPYQKQARDQKKMVDNLKPGDRVVTQGGLCGTVATLKPTVVQIKIAENVKVDVLRSAITQVVTEPSNGTSQPLATAGERNS